MVCCLSYLPATGGQTQIVGNEFEEHLFRMSIFVFVWRPAKSPLDVAGSLIAILSGELSYTDFCHLSYSYLLMELYFLSLR